MMQQLIRTLLAAVVLLAFSVTSQAEVTVTYLHTDALGSVVAASDEDGDLLWRKAYMPYGAIHENGQAKNPAVGYTGHVQDDDTGLTYMGARYYDPALGRFLQMDPAGVLDNVESNPMMFNRYAYANGNPYKFIDPDGEAPKNRDGGHAANLGGAILVGLGVRTSDDELLAQGIVLPKAKGGSKAKKGAKRGPKTDPNAPHNKKIREVGEQIEAEGGTVLAGGGQLKEKLIPTPGGHKSGRRPDILYKDCEGNLCGTNVGKTKADDSPIKREQQALDDLNGAGLPTTFQKYD
ncbi:RHS repeat-associated core domain-containing protein [Microbulbifer sp. MLAF003]|uniref:RHS repeat domain-containing protein n=1 Tax=Microbulbifer sp. MLAF003 TaxID=3032582 RepID=UPI0024AC8A2A|nr:RHS repeat-associated core domain-containing protein [Microbulbifer sp. MLAF003]WHI49544.1 RHS repeat-associated core domain-containing protein [Microbulbifer sp. MLAF003]